MNARYVLDDYRGEFESKRGSARIDAFELPEIERDHLEAFCRRELYALSACGDVDDGVRRTLAAIISRQLHIVAPRLSAALCRTRAGIIDATYVRKLPTDLEIAKLILLTSTYMLGFAFNYRTQNRGKIVMELLPDFGSKVRNTNDSPEEFGPHTDDAGIARGCRAAHISLYGIINPTGTLTGYAPIHTLIEELSPRTREALFEPRYTVRLPASFKLGTAVWTDAVSILSRAPDGSVEIAWPSYAADPCDKNDREAENALTELKAAVDRHMLQLPIDPGCMLCFSNLRGVHKRSRIEGGNRHVLRTYACESLSELKIVTGSDGPIFDTHAVVAARRR